MNRKIYLLPGMTPDQRVFQKLAPCLPGCEIVDWIDPSEASSIAEYARLLADDLAVDSPCDVRGVSFGGMVAQELAPLVGATFCFVVSSIQSAEELPQTKRLLSSLPMRLRESTLGAVGLSATCLAAQISRDDSRTEVRREGWGLVPLGNSRG